ncbi:MAG: DMT family transporter [Dehalococcoidia bacterium]
MTARQLAALLTAATIWGGSFLFIRVLVDAGVEPMGVAASRMAIGVVTLAPFAVAARGQLPRRPSALALLAVLGVVNFAVPFTLFGFAEQRVTSGTAAVVNASMPFWTAILAALFVAGEGFTRSRTLGLVAGFLGVAAVASGDVAVDDGGAVTGVLLVLLATFCYGVSAVAIRRWLMGVPALWITTLQLLFGALVVGPLALATGAYDDAAMGLAEWSSMLALGAGGSALAILLYMWLIGEVGPVRAAVVTYLPPPIGVFLGWLLLGEPIGWGLIAGLVLVVGGVAMVQGPEFVRLAVRSMFRRPVVEPAPLSD